MKRGDIIPVVQPGAYGKPLPALLIQSNFFLEVHPSKVEKTEKNVLRAR